MQEIQSQDWSTYKALVASKTMAIQYVEFVGRYELYAAEAGIFTWRYSLSKDGGADQTDFEMNYKPTANAAMMISGRNPVVPAITEQQLFTATAIRDTVAHNSVVCVAWGYPNKTIIISNQLDQPVTFVAFGSRDQTNWISLGFTWTVAAGTWDYQTCGTYFPYGLITATCAVAPTTGTIDLWIEKVGG